ncbi:flagellar filament capping protein FliD [Pseudodesulfovibrio sp.]|uniref:flagellar filament capping protein FliD n=1 Tax=unclassified Pseudodesulfovibrio TaxID=2661612 RepID=UPI003AFFD24D
MAEYTSGAINFAGLGNGTDFNQLIDGLIKVEQGRVTRLEDWKSSWSKKREQFDTLNSQLLTLKTTLEGFDTINEFMTKTASSVNTSYLVATANSEAQETTHAVEIGQLATTDTHITASGVGTLLTSIITSNANFTFTYAGKTHTISNISAGTSLQGFVNIINNHAESRGLIRASTIFDGSVYHLQLNGMDQGADNQLVIADSAGFLFQSSDFNESQNAVNSMIKVNGFPPETYKWIERPTNVIKDVIEGVTLDLKDTTIGATVQVTISTNTDDIKKNIEKFVNAVNAVRSQLQAITDVDDDGKGSILTGNYGVDMISQNLKNITADMGQGFVNWDPKTSKGDRFAALSQIGIGTDAESGSKTYGLLKIDYEGLDEALDKDPEAVARLMSAKNEGESTTPDFTYLSQVEGTTQPGTYNVEVVSDGTKILSATINGEEAKVSGWEITAKTGDALGLAFRLDNSAVGTHKGVISVRMGKTGEMVNELKDLTKPYNELTYEGGPLAVLKENYKTIMDNIDDKIAFEKKRIDTMEKNLKLKYARLDALLGQYQLRQGQLDSAITQMSSS